MEDESIDNLRRGMVKMQFTMEAFRGPDSYRDDGNVITLLRDNKPYGVVNRGWFYGEMAKLFTS